MNDDSDNYPGLVVNGTPGPSPGGAGVTALAVEKEDHGGPSPWVVKLTTGPDAGKQIGDGFARKRDAMAWVDTVAHLPWQHLQSLQHALDDDALVVTIPSEALRSLQHDRDRLDVETRAAQRVLIHVDGSAMAMDQARRDVRTELGVVA